MYLLLFKLMLFFNKMLVKVFEIIKKIFIYHNAKVNNDDVANKVSIQVKFVIKFTKIFILST